MCHFMFCEPALSISRGKSRRTALFRAPTVRLIAAGKGQPGANLVANTSSRSGYRVVPEAGRN